MKIPILLIFIFLNNPLKSKVSASTSCKCTEKSIEDIFCDSSFTIKAIVKSKNKLPGHTVYDVKVLDVYKWEDNWGSRWDNHLNDKDNVKQGFDEKGDLNMNSFRPYDHRLKMRRIWTPKDKENCGRDLDINNIYIISGIVDKDEIKAMTNLCEIGKKHFKLSLKEKHFFGFGYERVNCRKSFLKPSKSIESDMSDSIKSDKLEGSKDRKNNNNSDKPSNQPDRPYRPEEWVDDQKPQKQNQPNTIYGDEPKNLFRPEKPYRLGKSELSNNENLYAPVEPSSMIDESEMSNDENLYVPVKPPSMIEEYNYAATPPGGSCGCQPGTTTPPGGSCGCQPGTTTPSGGSCGCQPGTTTPPGGSCGCQPGTTPPGGSCGCQPATTTPPGVSHSCRHRTKTPPS
jgi:hypothetical protein